MVMFVWDYYFTLLNEMAIESDTVPVLTSIVHYCNETVQFQWNMLDCVIGEHFLKCRLRSQSSFYYVQGQMIEEDIIVDNEFLNISKWACGKWIIWSLPVT